MMIFHLCRSIFLSAVFVFMSSCGSEEGADSEENTPEMQEKMEIIKQKVTEYIDAVNAQDIDKVVEQWSEKAVYKDPVTGQLVTGKEGIRNEFKKLFERYKGASVSVDIESIRFPIEEKAVEEGTATMTMPNQKPVKSENKIIYINENGKWKILHVSQLGFGLKEN